MPHLNFLCLRVSVAPATAPRTWPSDVFSRVPSRVPSRALAPRSLVPTTLLSSEGRNSCHLSISSPTLAPSQAAHSLSPSTQPQPLNKTRSPNPRSLQLPHRNIIKTIIIISFKFFFIDQHQSVKMPGASNTNTNFNLTARELELTVKGMITLMEKGVKVRPVAHPIIPLPITHPRWALSLP